MAKIKPKISKSKSSQWEIIDDVSTMGYRDDSPYRNRESIDINTLNGLIDMSETGMPILANGIFLPPYSGIHQFEPGVVKEERVMQDGGQYLTVDEEYHRVYRNAQGDIIVNHPKEDKGKWDTINLTDKSDANTIAEGVSSVKKWHKENPYAFGGNVILEKYKGGGELIKRTDGSYSKRGLWDNIRENAGSGKKPTKEMLKQEKKIRVAEKKAANGKEIKKSTKNSYRDPLLGVNIPIASINPMSQKADYLYNTLNPNEEDPFEAINYIRYKTGIKRSIPEKDDAHQNEAFWKKYLGMPNDVAASQYRDPAYPKVKQFLRVNDLLENAIFNKYKNINVPDSVVNEGSLPINEWYTPLGNYTVGKGKDKKGEFVYYRDIYDFPSKVKTEFKAGKDYNIYNKKYLDEYENGGQTSDWEIVKDFDEMSEYKNGGKTPAWQRKEGKSPTGGLNAKGRASLKAEGHDIKPPQPQGGTRKKSFCARMKGMKKKNTSAKTANDPNSRINLSLKKWKC
jgi:hypothetical protein